MLYVRITATMLMLAVIGCNSRSGRQAADTRVDSIGHYLKDSIVLNEGGSNTNLRVNITEADPDARFDASVYIANESKLILYNTHRKQVVRMVDLTAALNRETADIFVDTAYTIYAIQWMRNEILQLDTNGSVRNTFRYPAIDKARGFRAYLHPSFSVFKPNRNGDFVFYTIPTVNISEPNGRQALLNNRPIKVFSLADGKVQVKTEGGFFPDLYKRVNYYDLDIRYTMIGDSVIAYVFRMVPEIIIENIYTGSLERKHIEGLDTISSAPYLNKDNDFTYGKAYETSNSYYNGFVYDQQKKRYYLFRNNGIPATSPDGSLALYEDKPVVLYVIDGATFKVIKKMACSPEGTYWYFKPFARNGRLYLTRRVADKKGAPVIIDIYDIL